MEPYVPKKVQEQQKAEEVNKSKDDTNSLSETGRNSKKKKKKNNKRNDERKDTAEKKNTDKPPPPNENNGNTAGKKAENKENNKKKEKDLRETLENKKTSKMMSGSQSNPDFKTPSNNSRNDDINVKRVSQENARSNRKNGTERVDYYEAARKKNNRHSYHDNYDRRDTYRYQSSHQNDNGHREGTRGGYGGGKDLRRGQSFGYDTDRRSERGGSGAKEIYRQHHDYRPNSPSSWNWKGGRGKGGGGNNSRGNSRVSSPSRSQRGNSPQSSRGNSRRNSPSGNFRTESPVHHTQFYYR